MTTSTPVRTGARLRSTACTTEVIVVRAPAHSAVLSCGGHPMVVLGSEAEQATPLPELAGGTELGKRYTDPGNEVEVLCTRPGPGTLTLDGVRLEQLSARTLPSSD